MSKIKNISIIDVVEAIVTSLRYTSTVVGVSTISTGVYAFTTRNAYTLAVGNYITIGSVSYLVTDVTGKLITVTGASIPVGTTWVEDAPYFYHGTPIEANKDHLNDLRGNMLKYPFICLWEPIESQFIPDESNSIGEVASLNMVFMTTADNEQWTTSQHHANAITVCKNIMLRFIEACEKSPYLATDMIDQFNVVYHAKWALYARTRGKQQYIFMENLSGVEANGITINLKKEFDCKT